MGAIAALDKDIWGFTEIHREPKKVQPVPATKGKADQTKHIGIGYSPLQMRKHELLDHCDKLEVKVMKHEATIKELRKNMKNGGDDGEGGKTYNKQLYESRNGEFQEMTQERLRLTGINEKLQEAIETLKTAAVKAENEKLLFQKDYDAQGSILSRVEEDNKQLKAHVFRTHNYSTYAGAGSMSVRGPSPNENAGYTFISPM